MSLTHEDLNKLKAWFPVNDHEFDYSKNCYITEYAITNRLEEVDPAWSLTAPVITTRTEHGEKGLTIVTVVLQMTVKGVTRTGLGRSDIELRKDGSREADQAEKSAATDALKRCARLFGVGRYLLTLDKGVKDYPSLQKWFNDNKPKEKTWLDDETQVSQVKLNLASMMDAYGDSALNQAKNKIDPRQFTNATDYLQSLDALAQGIYDARFEENTGKPSQPANTIAPDFSKQDSKATGQAVTAWDKVAATKFWGYWRVEVGVEDASILSVLNVSKLGDFNGTLEDANKRMENYMMHRKPQAKAANS